jgi:hypothetical protein
MKIEKNAPALPCMPMQDSLGRFFSPISGFTKYEYVVLNIYSALLAVDADDAFSTMKYAIQSADIYFNKLNDLQDEKDNISTIIQ